MKRMLCLLLIMVIGTSVLMSQARMVSGTVTGAEDGSPLPGVSVSVRGTSVGTITGRDGRYQINVPESADVLVFSFVGLLTREVDLSGQERISAAKNTDLLKSLQGKIAGITVKQSSGMPGATSHVTIRGKVSLTGDNQPLYVVDGCPSCNPLTPRETAERWDCILPVHGVPGSIRFRTIIPSWTTSTWKIPMKPWTDLLLRPGQLQPGFPAEPGGGMIDDYTYQRQELNSNLSLRINRDFGKIGIDAILGNEFYDITTNLHSMTGTDIPIGGFDHLSNTDTQVAIQELTRQRVVGFYGTATADYASMLLLTVTGRNDIVSNMPSGNRPYFYPSVSLGFVFKQLAFLQYQQVLPFGKIRTFYSQMGQAGDLYATRTLFTPKEGTEAIGSGFLNNEFTFPYMGNPAFTLQSVLLSSDLRPQNVTTWEAGADLRF